MNEQGARGIQKFLVRSCMVLFWCGVCMLFLWVPTFIGYLMPRQKQISILTWPLVIDLRVVAAFEKETGIRVLVNYYEKNEELFTKLMVNKGRGYDLIITTDFSVEQLIAHNLLKKTDHASLNFWQYMRPGVLGHYFDPENKYSIPYFVSMYGIGIDRTAFATMPEASWSLIFEKGASPAAIGMIEDTREAIFIAGQYLYKTTDFVNAPDWAPQIISLLKRQKEWVYLYTDARVEDLLTSRSVQAAVAMSVDIWKIKKEYPAFDFLLPKEGGFLVMESCVIPASSSNDALVYQFINYLFKPDVVRHHVQLYGVCPSITNAVVEMPPSLCVTDEQMRRIPFFRNTISKEMVNQARIAVMAS